MQIKFSLFRFGSAKSRHVQRYELSISSANNNGKKQIERILILSIIARADFTHYDCRKGVCPDGVQVCAIMEISAIAYKGGIVEVVEYGDCVAGDFPYQIICAVRIIVDWRDGEYKVYVAVVTQLNKPLHITEFNAVDSRLVIVFPLLLTLRSRDMVITGTERSGAVEWHVSSKCIVATEWCRYNGKDVGIEPVKVGAEFKCFEW